MVVAITPTLVVAFSLAGLCLITGCGKKRQRPADVAEDSAPGHGTARAGAGGAGSAAPSTADSTDRRLLPLVGGRSWTFTVSAVAGAGPPQCAPGEQTARVLAAATESVPPTYIYRPICSDADFTLVGKGDQLQARPVNAADRMFMYLDTPVEEGHRWQDSVGRSLSWHKAGSVTVPAGTYHDCWERRLASATENGAVTFCRGVGQVRYSMSSYSAELRSKSF